MYRDLLDVQWQEGFIPKDQAACRRMIGCSVAQMTDAWDVVLEKFPLSSSNAAYRRNPKMARERERALSAIAVQTEAGKRGAELKRKQRLKEGTLRVGSGDSEQILDLRSESKDLRQDLKNLRRAKAPDMPVEAFEQLKLIYPKRAGDQRWPKAKQACNARIKEGATVQQLLDGAQRYAEFVRASDSEGSQYVKMASTFFGTEKGFENAWQKPAAKSERLVDRNIQNSQDWLEETSDDRRRQA